MVTKSTIPVNFYAYSEDTAKQAATQSGTTSFRPPTSRSKDKDKSLKYSNNIQGERLDITGTLQLTFAAKITTFDSSKLLLTNKQFEPIKNYIITHDTAANVFTIRYTWLPNTPYNLLIAKDAFADSAGNTLAKNDTLKFTTKREEDYGSIKIRFNNLDFSKNPVLQIVQGEQVVEAIPLTQRDWSRKYFKPGEYEMRILFDSNKNGIWDAGEFFGKHRQPEVVKFIDTKLSVRGNWDNEKEITL